MRLLLVVEKKGHATAGSVLKIWTFSWLVGSQITHGDSIRQKWNELGINFLSAFTDAKYLFPHSQSSNFWAYCDTHWNLWGKWIYCASTLPFQKWRHFVDWIALNEIFALCSFWWLFIFCFMESKKHSPGLWSCWLTKSGWVDFFLLFLDWLFRRRVIIMGIIRIWEESFLKY